MISIYSFRIHVNSYRLFDPHTNGWFHSNVPVQSTTNMFQNDAQSPIVVVKQQLKLKDSIIKGDPREFLG